MSKKNASRKIVQASKTAQTIQPHRMLILVTLLFFMLGLFRMWPAFVHDNLTLATSGPGWDGIGSIGWFFAYGEAIKTNLWQFLRHDIFTTNDIGLGLHGVPVLSLFWRIHHALSGMLLSPKNMYHITLLLGFTLQGSAAFYLTRALVQNYFIACISALAIVGLEVFDARCIEHIGLSLYYCPLLVCLCSIYAAQKIQTKRMVYLGLLQILSTMINEYYAFYGGIFAICLFIGYFLRYQYNNLRSMALWQQFFKGLVCSITLVAALMCVAYPDLIPKPWMQQTMTDSKPATTRPKSSLDFYSLRHAWGMLTPGINALKAVMPEFLQQDAWEPKMHQIETYEFTYHLGIVHPLLLILLIIIAWRMQACLPWWPMLVWGGASILMVGFALPSTSAFSLQNIAWSVAPMFRVGMRAVLFTQIGMLIVTAMVLASIWPMCKTKQQQYVFIGLTSIVYLLGHLDMRPNRSGVWSQLPTYALPWGHSHLSVLQQAPKGTLLELPMITPRDNLNVDYLYMGNRVVHGQPIFNGVDASRYVIQNAVLASYMNSPTPDTLTLLRYFGIQYVATNPSRLKNDAFYQAHLNPMADHLWSVPQSPHLTVTQQQERLGGHCMFHAGLLFPIKPSNSQLVESSDTPGIARLTYVSSDTETPLAINPYVTLATGTYDFTFAWAAHDVQARTHAPMLKAIIADQTQRILAEKIIYNDATQQGLQHIALQVRANNAMPIYVGLYSIAPGRYLVDSITCQTK